MTSMDDNPRVPPSTAISEALGSTIGFLAGFAASFWCIHALWPLAWWMLAFIVICGLAASIALMTAGGILLSSLQLAINRRFRA